MKSSKTILAFVNAKINEYTSALAAESNPILKEHLKQILAEYSAIKRFIVKATTRFITIDSKKWVDLGLPSGRLWAAENEAGHHQYNEAIKTFGEQLPSAAAWQELFDQCNREWDDERKGYILTGPNGNTLFLPADGWQNWDIKTEELNESVFVVGNYGYYWSSTPNSVDSARYVLFCSDDVYPQNDYYRLYGFSVRLARKSK